MVKSRSRRIFLVSQEQTFRGGSLVNKIGIGKDAMQTAGAAAARWPLSGVRW